MNEFLFEPWKEVNHHYKKIKLCRKSLRSSIIRHNFKFRISNGVGILKCIYCGYKIRNENFLGTFYTNANSLERDKEKEVGSINIYRIYWYKHYKKGFLKFPGLNYIGQTKKTVYKRLFGNGGHFIKAFNNPSTPMEYSIKKYGKNFKNAKKVFKFSTLQVVDFQENWKKINKELNKRKRKVLIEEAKEKTQILANDIEKFWIGFYHSQYYRFGRNILPGGKKTRDFASLDFKKLDKAIDQASVLPRKMHRKNYVFKKLGLKPTQTRLLDMNIKKWYGIKNKPFERVIRKKRLKKIKKHFENGYKIIQIANKINANRSDIRFWLTNKIYNKNFLNMKTKEIRAILISKKIRYLVGRGYDKPSEIINQLPGFINTEALKHFIRKYMEGWDRLMENYSPKKDYWNIMKDLVLKKYEKFGSKNRRLFKSVEYAQKLGSKAKSSSAAIKFIKRKLNTELSWLEIVDKILNRYKNKE